MVFAMMAWLPPQLWAQTQPSGGDGSSEKPFLITSAEELKWYANYVNGESGDGVVHNAACAKLVNDIDLSAVCGKDKGNWTPIAKYKADENTLHPEADNNGSHDEAYRYVSDRHGSKTHSATCSVCGYIVKFQDCIMVDHICSKCNYGYFDLFELPDGEAYTLANGAEVGELKYIRNFDGTNWTTWYVPFELKLTPELCQTYAFSRINNVHQYDDNNDGVADRTIVESFNQAEGVTLKANYPYLVRALTDDDKEMTITLTEVELANAESKHIDCMSVDHTYTFTGTYNEMGDGGTEANSPLSLFDYSDGNMWLNFHSLPAQRHYLVITPRDGSTPTLAPARVMLQVIGDETVTGIVNLYGRDKRSAETYDLSGRRVGSSQRGLLIKNGQKVLVK